jgi:hypothetical protein
MDSFEFGNQLYDQKSGVVRQFGIDREECCVSVLGTKLVFTCQALLDRRLRAASQA